MTKAPEDEPAIWLKQVPVWRNTVPGIWSQELIPNHRAVRRSRERPTETVDGPTLSRLLLALENLPSPGKHFEALPELQEACLAYTAYRHFEIHREDS